eukprot:2601162-Prymnesium_polylepis.1
MAAHNCTAPSVLASLPASIQQLGTELLADKLGEYERRLVFARTRLLGNTLCVAHLKTDDSLQQLRNEDRNDYGLRRWVNETTTDLIFDVGANMGEFSIAAARRAPRALVVTVEPVPPTYWLLRINLWLAGVNVLPESALMAPPGSVQRAGVVTIHAALGADADVNAMHYVYYSLYRKSQAAFTTATPRPQTLFTKGFFGGWRAKRVSVRSIEGLARHRKLALLKMDCEGCEFSAIGSMRRAFFADTSRIEHVVGEIHWGMLRASPPPLPPSPPPSAASVLIGSEPGPGGALRVRGSPPTRRHAHGTPNAQTLERAQLTLMALEARGCALRGDELRLSAMQMRNDRRTRNWGGALPLRC